MRALIRIFVRIYQFTVSPLLAAIGGPDSGCRFQPTCSEYFLQAVESHGPLRGTLLGLKRIARCHPWGGSGEDRVPPRPEHACRAVALRRRVDLARRCA